MNDLELTLAGGETRLEWTLVGLTNVGEERVAFLDENGEARLILTAEELAGLQEGRAAP